MNKKILHIATWYPNKNNPKEALWVKRHVDSLNELCENEVWHIRCLENQNRFKLDIYEESGVKHVLFQTPIKTWILIEIISTILLITTGLKNRKLIANVDIINFHIAYPNLTFWRALKWLYRKPVIITEHWSAYHFNFGVKKQLPRIQAIFKVPQKLIVVSKSLGEDICTFIGRKIDYVVIPNVVDSKLFKFEKCSVVHNSFFMLSQWKEPKKPLKVLKAFQGYLVENPDSTLYIGGYGELEDEILSYIKSNNLERYVFYLGKLNEVEIANLMNKTMCFIHLSEYETFSVVCAEALSCGCPVIASDVGGIKEFVNDSNGILINNSDMLFDAMEAMSNRIIDRKLISINAHSLFSRSIIGKKYFDVLKKLTK